jgi:hypothetical protein
VLFQLDAKLAALSDRLDPMLVRCVRQDLRSKMFIAVFSLLLLWSTAFSLIAATSAAASNDPDRTSGRWLFALLAWSWSFALIVVQAAATHRLVAQERNDDTWDLVELTGLPPRCLVRGLLAASLTQSALYTAAMAPFLVMAYLLRGLDLLTILAALVTVPMLGIVAATVALFLACAAPNKKASSLGSIFSGLILLLLMLKLWFFTCIIQFSAWDSGLTRLLRGLADGQTWALVSTGIGINAWIALVFLGLVFATTLLTHRADDRSHGPRLAVAVVWLNLLAWVGGVWWCMRLAPAEIAVVLAGIGIAGAGLTTIAAFFACTEDYLLTPRQARGISESHGWRRKLSAFTGPGAARGRWYVLALGLSVAVLLGAGLRLGTEANVHKTVATGWFTLGYGLITILAGDWLARVPLGRWCTQPLHRRLVVLGLASAISIFPVLAAMVISEHGPGYAAMILLTPGWAVYHYAIEEPGEALAVVPMALPIIAAAWATGQAARHRMLLTRRVLAEASDHNPRN